MLPEAVVSGMIAGPVERVVDRRDEQDEVRKACGDLVEQDGLARELLALGEGITTAA